MNNLPSLWHSGHLASKGDHRRALYTCWSSSTLHSTPTAESLLPPPHSPKYVSPQPWWNCNSEPDGCQLTLCTVPISPHFNPGCMLPDPHHHYATLAWMLFYPWSHPWNSFSLTSVGFNIPCNATACLLPYTLLTVLGLWLFPPACIWCPLHWQILHSIWI